MKNSIIDEKYITEKLIRSFNGVNGISVKVSETKILSNHSFSKVISHGKSISKLVIK
ncbi:MAG: hypothetical protein JEZ08_12670 [Clostridiales bacterium]|nr:hypothetical protein [Clostridiales bacterium]